MSQGGDPVSRVPVIFPSAMPVGGAQVVWVGPTHRPLGEEGDTHLPRCWIGYSR